MYLEQFALQNLPLLSPPFRGKKIEAEALMKNAFFQ